MANTTYKQILYELPVDALLQNFLASFNIAIPEDVEMSDEVIRESSEAIAALIDGITDYNRREEIDSQLVALQDFKSRTAQKAVYDAIACEKDHESIQAEMGLLVGPIHRALWLKLNHQKILDRASSFLLFDNKQNSCQRRKFDEGLVPVFTEQNKQSFCKELSEYYTKNQACGKKVNLDVTPRKENRWHFHILISGRLETEDIYNDREEIVPQSVRHPLHVSFEYSSDSGLIEITEKNFKLMNAILKAFAKNYLGREIDPYALTIPDMNFDCFLSERIESAIANEYQIEEIQVQRLDFSNDDDGVFMSYSAKGKGTESVYTKIGRVFDDKADRLKDIEISSVTLKFHLSKWQNSFSAKGAFSVTLKNKGGIGWGKLTETEKDKVIDILADLGVVNDPATNYDQTWKLICRLFRHDAAIRDATIKEDYSEAFEYLKKHDAIAIGKDKSRAMTCKQCGELVEVTENEDGDPVLRCQNCQLETVLTEQDLRVWILKRSWLLGKIAAAFFIPPRKHEPAPIVVLGEYDHCNIVVAHDIDLVAHDKDQLEKLHENGQGEPWIIAPAKANCNPMGMKFIPFEERFEYGGAGLVFHDFTLNGLNPTDSRFPVHGGFSSDYMWYTDKETGKKTKMSGATAKIFRYMYGMTEAETVGDILIGAGLKGTSFSQYFQERNEDEKERKVIFDRLVKQDEYGKYYLVKE